MNGSIETELARRPLGKTLVNGLAVAKPVVAAVEFGLEEAQIVVGVHWNARQKELVVTLTGCADDGGDAVSVAAGFEKPSKHPDEALGLLWKSEWVGK